MKNHHISEIRACRVLGVSRSSYRYDVKRLPDKEVRARIIEFACNFERTGYHQVIGLLRNLGMLIKHRKAYPCGTGGAKPTKQK